jgi:hypothetical protein
MILGGAKKFVLIREETMKFGHDQKDQKDQIGTLLKTVTQGLC